MPRIESFRLQPVEFMPDQLEQGVLYASKEYGVAIHLCACGCGTKTVTPTTGDGWVLAIHEDNTATLNPSISNYQDPCKSHYFLTRGKVVWCKP